MHRFMYDLEPPIHRSSVARRMIRILPVVLALLAGVAGLAAAQGGTVRGVVVSEQTLRPIAGAQVVVAGAGRGTTTDAAGRFALTDLSGTQVNLEVSMLGYGTARRTVNIGDQSVRIGLSPSAVALDELVITGTPGGQSRREVGNVVSRIRAEDVVAQAPISSVQDLLNGRAPGVVIIPGSGNVGTGSRIRVRGVHSLSLQQEPLIYVDGVRVNNTQATGPINQGFGSSSISRFNDFNPDEIESVEIIKGPAAATLYGTEAANGVIQIITKKGSQGAPRWNLTVKEGTNWFANPTERLWTNYGRAPSGEILSLDMATLFRQEEERGTPIYQTGRLQDYDLSVSGGAPAVRYYLGANWERNEGIKPDNKLGRRSGRANLTISPSDKVEATASVGYVNSRLDLPLESGGGGVEWSTYFANPLNLRPLANGNPHPRRGFHSATPEAYRYAYKDWQDLNRFTGSFQVNHKPLSWLSHRVAVGTDLTVENNVELVERIEDPAMQVYFTPGEIRGYKDLRNYRVSYHTLDWAGTGNFNLMPNLVSTTSVGAQFYRTAIDTLTSYGEDFPARGLTAIRAAATQRGSDNRARNTTVGVFVQQQFGWQDRLFLTAAIRADDNSAFGQDFDLVYYPKVSGAWVLSEEPFFNVPAISTLRLRAAYGQSGQQPLSFAALRTFRSIPGPGDVSAVTPELVGNPALGPERGEEIELGFDAGMLDERLGLELTYYDQTTSDAILLSDIAPSTGFSGQQYVNAGKIKNRGWELLARATPVLSDRVGWDVNLTFATNDNEVTDLGGKQFISSGTFVRHVVGYPVGAWWEKRVLNARFNPNGSLIAGSEICDDGKGGELPCTQAPVVYLGRPTPRLESALSSTLTLFNTVRLYGLLDVKRGYNKLDGNLRVRCYLFFRCRENFYPTEFTDDPAYLAEIQRGGVFVSRLINDASFARLRELSASVTIPRRYVRSFGAADATLTIAGRNLYTWTDYSGLEPEASFIGGSRGGGSAQWEQNVVPQLQQFVATLNLRF